MLRYTTRPVSDRSAFDRRPRQASPFRTGWTQALDLLEAEYDALDGSELVIEVDVREQDIRNDGLLRANARPEHPGVRVAFESTRGPLLFACDRYEAHTWQKMTSWQANVYAIAKTMEALRAVERWGAAETHEQYAGYRQIAGPGAQAALPPMVVLREVLEVNGVDVTGMTPEQMVRRARRVTHPDSGGSAAEWNAVNEAARAMGVGA